MVLFGFILLQKIPGLITREVNKLMDYEKLVKEAEKAKEFAYVPYSKFRVGAAVLAKDGKVYTGCNIENASYGLTNCAERTALYKAVSEGNKEFQAIAISTDLEDAASPCGACRQVLAEFGLNYDVLLANVKGQYSVMKVKDLLPLAFTPAKLKEERV